MAKYDPRYIDSEERQLVSDLKKMDVAGLKRFRRTAAAFVEKEAKMNIRIASTELAQIKAKAQTEGLKYQSLVKSVLHKYVTGQLVERSKKVG
jgi:predicted DNA binding CopG/RHH family protein